MAMLRVNNIIIQIRYNFKLVNRNLNVFVQILLLSGIVAFLIMYGDFGNNSLTIMILIILATMLTTPLLGNMFWGTKNELLLYYIIPVKINTIVLVKNYTMIFLISLYYLIILIFLIIYGVNTYILTQVILLFLLLIFVVSQLVNYQTVLYHKYKILNNPLVSTITTLLLIIAFCSPFFILVLSFKLYGIFIIYNIIIIASWYFIAIPYTTRYFEENWYKILGPDYDNHSFRGR